MVEHIAKYFHRHGIDTWWAPRDILPGSKWDEAITAAINRASALVLLFCASADTSIHVKREVALADRAKIPIYWVRLEQVEPEGLGYYLSPTQWVDWLDRRDDTLDDLVGDLKNPAVEGRGLEPGESRRHRAPARVSGWPAGVVAFDNEALAAEAAAHTYFRMANDAPHRSVVLPTGRAATLLSAMLRIAD